MAGKKIIVIGDRTSHGGYVITGSSRMSIDGIPVALVGDLVTCPKHSGTHRIVGGGGNITVDGSELAREGDPVSCGAVLVSAQQYRATHEQAGGEMSMQEAMAAASGAQGVQTASAATAASALASTDTGVSDDPTHQYAERFQLTDEETGESIANIAYCIEVNGEKFTGKSDSQGFTQWVNLEEKADVSVHWGRSAERHIRQQA